AAGGLRLEGSSVGVGRVVGEAEQRHQLDGAQCPRRAESFRLPAFRVISNRRQPPLQGRERREVAAVVVEAVNADLEPVLAQGLDELISDDVAVTWDEVPRRSVAGLDLDAKELRQLLVTELGLDVVSEHEGPSPVARPQSDEGDRSLCHTGNGGEEEIVEVVQGRLHGPAWETRFRLHATEGPPHAHLDAPG